MLRRTLLSTATAVRTGVLKTVKPVFSRSMGYYTNETIPFHRSDAEERINAIPPIEVEGYHAVCDGGGGGHGHPVEYIQLNTRSPETPQTCKYCGLRFVHKSHKKH